MAFPPPPPISTNPAAVNARSSVGLRGHEKRRKQAVSTYMEAPTDPGPFGASRNAANVKLPLPQHCGHNKRSRSVPRSSHAPEGTAEINGYDERFEYNPTPRRSLPQPHPQPRI